MKKRVLSSTCLLQTPNPLFKTFRFANAVEWIAVYIFQIWSDNATIIKYLTLKNPRDTRGVFSQLFIYD